MQERLNYLEDAPGLYEAMMGLERYLRNSGLESRLIGLVKIRASQINGCAVCLELHWRRMREDGETEQRLYSLDAWDEVSLYNDRERAALAWTESVTRVADGHVPDAIYHQVRQQFTANELANLTAAIATINAWNRLLIAGRVQPGKSPATAVPTPGNHAGADV